MIRSLRRRHRWLIPLLALIVGALYLLIMVRREPLPRPADARPATHEAESR